MLCVRVWACVQVSGVNTGKALSHLPAALLLLYFCFTAALLVLYWVSVQVSDVNTGKALSHLHALGLTIVEAHILPDKVPPLC
jgi:hypothetical protein